MSAYYNEIEPFAAQWLRNLIAKGLIADGEVDTRSIVDVSADDVRGFAQAHWFAGIGGWPYALRLAGWPDDRPVWTGSCPCQPFSVAGKGLGESDPRHLWPHFFRLISSARPPVVMGEQVAGAAGYGWLDGVRADLAREGYASRGVDIPACAVDAPHIRSRLYWVASDMADSDGIRRADERGARLRRADVHDVDRRGECNGEGDMADADHSERRADGAGRHDDDGAQARWRQGASDVARRRNSTFWSDAIRLTGADGKARRAQPGISLLAHGIPARVGRLRAYGNAIVPQLAAEVIAAFMEAQP